MGFFSWKTADTGESIANAYADHPNAGRTVYLLQPGDEPLSQSSFITQHPGDNGVMSGYEGYGMFGGVDAYVWLAQHNDNLELKLEDKDELRSMGIELTFGKYYIDTQTKEMWAYGAHTEILRSKVDIKSFPGGFETVIPEIGLKPNELIACHRFQERPSTDFLGKVKAPLKFSFNQRANYRELPASKNCPEQGYWY
ncbi:MAG: hypothetical protein V3S33_02260 [Gammaproteobacteria bacterium]